MVILLHSSTRSKNCSKFGDLSNLADEKKNKLKTSNIKNSAQKMCLSVVAVVIYINEIN